MIQFKLKPNEFNGNALSNPVAHFFCIFVIVLLVEWEKNWATAFDRASSLNSSHEFVNKGEPLGSLSSPFRHSWVYLQDEEGNYLYVLVCTTIKSETVGSLVLTAYIINTYLAMLILKEKFSKLILCNQKLTFANISTGKYLNIAAITVLCTVGL